MLPVKRVPSIFFIDTFIRLSLFIKRSISLSLRICSRQFRNSLNPQSQNAPPLLSFIFVAPHLGQLSPEEKSNFTLSSEKFQYSLAGKTFPSFFLNVRRSVSSPPIICLTKSSSILCPRITLGILTLHSLHTYPYLSIANGRPHFIQEASTSCSCSGISSIWLHMTLRLSSILSYASL